MSIRFDDNSYPGTSTVFIEARWGNNWYIGSGALVGENDVLTAAHVIYDSKLGRIADEIKVYPSYNPLEYNKHYTTNYVRYYPDFDPDADRFLIPGDSSSSGMEGSEIDIALLTLDEKIGSIFGWYGMDPNYSGGSVSVLGYPSKYSNYLTFDRGSLYESNIDNIFSIGADLEVNPGNSGGPIFYTNSANLPYLVGVVSTRSSATSIADHWWWLKDAINAEANLSKDIDGTSAGDNLSGTSKDEALYGYDGDDILQGGGGNDTLYGGKGLDTAKYAGIFSNYKIEPLYEGKNKTYTGLKITDLTGSEGVDKLSGIERLIFQSDVIFDISESGVLTRSGGAKKISGTNKSETLNGTSSAETIDALDGDDTLVGGGGNDTLYGGKGFDSAKYSGSFSNYKIEPLYEGKNGAHSGHKITDLTGSEGVDKIYGVERLVFKSSSLALDLDKNAGNVAKMLGAVFGKGSVYNKELAGIGLSLLDDGMSYEALMKLALEVRLGSNASNENVVKLLYENVAGTTLPKSDLIYFTSLIEGGSFTQTSLAVFAADHKLNTVNVDLIGLSHSGLEYIPFVY